MITKKGNHLIGKFIAKNDRTFVIEVEGQPKRLAWRNVRSFGPYREASRPAEAPGDGLRVEVCPPEAARCGQCLRCLLRDATARYHEAAGVQQATHQKGRVFRRDLDLAREEVEVLTEELEQVQADIRAFLEAEGRPVVCQKPMCGASIWAVGARGRKKRIYEVTGRPHVCKGRE